MNAGGNANDEQAALWNGLAGQGWVENQALLDHIFKPVEALLVEEVLAASATRVLDIGCGTGATTLAVAQGLGSKGRCVGVDISDPMITAARKRAERGGTPASFIRADAQTHDFGLARFDMIISRFGVMFFDDPVRAFRNLRRVANDNAELRVVVWRSTAENPFMTTAERAAAPLLPAPPARQPDAPGQFAFADQHRVSRILEASGWSNIRIQPLDVSCGLPEKELPGYLTRLGPVGRLLHDADEHKRTQVVQTVRAAFEPYVHGPEVRFNAACWMVGARALSCFTN